MLSDFIAALFGTGVIQVDPPGAIEQDLPALRSMLEQVEQAARLDAPPGAPEWSAEATFWALRWLYRASQCLVYREIGAEQIKALLREPTPFQKTAETTYSVDLVLRAMPELIARSRRLSNNDPLTDELLTVARAWPLSSIGSGDLGKLDLAAIREDACLRRMYCERVLRYSDLSRLNDDVIRQEIADMLGLFHELSPDVARHLREQDKDPRQETHD